jgi:hypothetical protein
METQHDYVLIALMLMLFWALGVPIFNWALTLIPKKYRIKIPPPKRYKNKKSPIYQLRQGIFSSFYSIQKWEIGWTDVYENKGWYILIPFSGFFMHKRYILLNDTYGEYTKKDIEDSYPELHDIAATYEKYKKEAEKKYRNLMKEEDLFENTLKDINSEFLENYE